MSGSAPGTLKSQYRSTTHTVNFSWHDHHVSLESGFLCRYAKLNEKFPPKIYINTFGLILKIYIYKY